MRLYRDGYLIERDPSFPFGVRRMVILVQQVHQFSARRLLVLISCQDYAGILPWEELLRIEYTGSSGQHSRTGDENSSSRRIHQCVPVFRHLHGADILRIKRVLSPHDPLREVSPQKSRITGIDAVHIAHHAVHINGDMRYFTVAHRFPEYQKNFLRPAQCEGRDQDLHALPRAIRHGLNKSRFFESP